MADERGMVYVENGIPVYRASFLGNCIRALVAARRGIEPAGFSETVATVLHEGNLHEADVLARLEGEYDWRPRSEQEEVELDVAVGSIDGARVRGHLDGIVEDAVTEKRQSRQPRIVEVKSMSAAAFRKWKRLRFEAFPHYAWQISVYMHALKMPALLVAKDRNSGQLDVFEVDEPPFSYKDVENRVVTVERYHREHADGQYPECEPGETWLCRYWSIHDDAGQPEQQEADVVHDPRLDSLVAEYQKVKDQEEELRLQREELRAEIDLAVGLNQKVRTGQWEIGRRSVTRVMLDSIKAKKHLAQLGVLDDYQQTTTANHLVITKRREQ